MTEGRAAPSGSLSLQVLRPWPCRPVTAADVAEHGCPRTGLLPEVAAWRRSNARHLRRGVWRLAAARRLGIQTVVGQLWLTVNRADGTTVPLGLASLRVVTDTGVGFIVDAFQNLVELENMKFHGLGTGTTAEAAAQTALVTELTTQYVADNTRATGSTTENAANVYRTVATNTVDAAAAVTEHGIFSQAATGGVLLDRSVFAVVNLAAADSLQSTYDFTVASGG